MCNSVMELHEYREEVPFGRGWKIFKSGSEFGFEKYLFGMTNYGGPKDMPFCPGRWIRYNKTLNAGCYGDGFCFFIDKLNCDRLLKRWRLIFPRERFIALQINFQECLGSGIMLALDFDCSIRGALARQIFIP